MRDGLRGGSLLYAKVYGDGVGVSRAKIAKTNED